MTIPSIHQPRKRFGQHFLHDPLVIQKIIHVIAPSDGECMVEIGPGLGALTEHLLPKAKTLQVIELDRDVIPRLQQHCQGLGNLIVHAADALKFDFSQLTVAHKKLRIAGNLPYNISTPLLFHLMKYRDFIQDMHFMLQKEVAMRIAAKAGDSDYGRLSIMLQYHCQSELLFDVGPGAFTPPPKVTSTVLRLVPHQEALFTCQNPLLLEQIVRCAFNQRRKTLKNALGRYFTPDDWRLTQFDSTLRPEQLTLHDYITLTNWAAQK